MASHFKCPFDFLLLLDFETTSDGTNCDFPFEIIQFSVAVLEVRTNSIRDDMSFNKYVRPTLRPVLTDHCSEFTGIDQETLDSAETFAVVYRKFLDWLAVNGIEEKKFAIACDSRQDMWRIAQYQLRLIGMCMPPFFRQYISLWRVFEAEQDRRGRKELFAKTYLGKMSEYYGIDSVGRAHNANDDCKTLGLIAQKMFQTGATVSINEVLVCYAVWRRKPLILPAGWRNSFRETSKVFERVMPLVVKAVRPSEYKPNEYGVCKYCKAPYQKCGSTHRQFPHDLYVMESDPIEFAELANYNFP